MIIYGKSSNKAPSGLHYAASNNAIFIYYTSTSDNVEDEVPLV